MPVVGSWAINETEYDTVIRHLDFWSFRRDRVRAWRLYGCSENKVGFSECSSLGGTL